MFEHSEKAHEDSDYSVEIAVQTYTETNLCGEVMSTACWLPLLLLVVCDVMYMCINWSELSA